MKVVKAKSDKLLYVRARGVFSQQRFHISKHSLELSYTWVLSSPSSSCCLHAEFSYSFLLFPLSKGPYFTQKIFDISRKISYVFGKTSHVFPKISNVFPKTLDFFSSQKEWAEDTQWNANSNGLARRLKSSPEKETFTWSSIRLFLHLQQHSHLKTFRQWILTK